MRPPLTGHVLCPVRGRELQRCHLTMLSNLTKNCQVFFENALNISRLGDILLLGSMDSYRASYVSELISSVISAKDNENLPSLKKLFCSQKRNNPVTDLSVFVSCWAFLCRFESRFLAGPSLPRTGNRPAFLCSDAASCAEMYHPEVAMLLSACPLQSLSPPFLPILTTDFGMSPPLDNARYMSCQINFP